MDHISIAVSDVPRTKSFYELVLKPLGWGCSGFRAGVYVGFKKPGSPALYFNASAVVAPAHLAFKAEREEQVMAFHRAALVTRRNEHIREGDRLAARAAHPQRVPTAATSAVSSA